MKSYSITKRHCVIAIVVINLLSNAKATAHPVPPSPQQLNLSFPAAKPTLLVTSNIYRSIISIAREGLSNGLPMSDACKAVRTELKRHTLRAYSQAELNLVSTKIVETANRQLNNNSTLAKK